MQLYTGNFLTGQAPNDVGKAASSTTCAAPSASETQDFPDSPNKTNFPTTTLRPEQWFTSTTVYKFSPRFPAPQP